MKRFRNDLFLIVSLLNIYLSITYTTNETIETIFLYLLRGV